MFRSRIASSGARWWWTLAAGAGIAFLTFVVMFVMIDVYLTIATMVSRGDVDQSQVQTFADFASVWALPVLFLVLTAGATAWMARRFGVTSLWFGVLVGAISAIGFQLIGLLFSPPETRELIVYPLCGVAGGLLGIFLGRISIAGREALYRASRDVGAASSADEVASAIGRHLAGSNVEQVSLWSVASREKDEDLRLDLTGSWSARTEALWPSGASLDSELIPDLVGMRRQSPRVVRGREVPESERANWERRGVRAVLLVPLSASGEGPDGLLAVASRGPRFSAGAVRAYLTVGAQAALALENLRLVRGARHSGMMDERRRLAHEIHDTLIQGFASIVMNLEAAEGKSGDDPARAYRHLREARRTARESMDEARRMVWALRPEALEGASLSEAFSRLAERWSESNGVEAVVTVTGSPRRLAPETEVTLLRVAQEALANVRKHAAASRVVLTLSYMEDRVTLDVQDDGVGFETAASRNGSGSSVNGDGLGGFGLRAMRERVEQNGGRLLVESEPGRGTALVAELPLAGGVSQGARASQEAR
ncbi:MAG TPA: sensor histidine kinase [Rubrobacteraceae bacterium]|nr:sensor histidine kinase [Rubrobacteraceae bacterium]